MKHHVPIFSAVLAVMLGFCPHPKNTNNNYNKNEKKSIIGRCRHDDSHEWSDADIVQQ